MKRSVRKSFYGLIESFLFMLSKLPLPVLYVLSSILAIKLNYLFRYRRKVVSRNLRNAFPEKSSYDLRKIRNRFYRNLTDLTMEVIKTQSIERDDLEKRIRFINYSVLEDMYQKNRSVIVTIGHCGNWEWMGQALDMKGPFPAFAVVKPMNDPFFENYLNRIRTRFTKYGGLIPFKSTLREMVKRKYQQSITVFAGDQTPVKEEIVYYTNFLNQDTPVFLGIEKISKALDIPVVFFDIQRQQRGKYTVEISLLEEFPTSSPEHGITELYVRALEAAIRRNPDNWLWSHRRWKHARHKSE